MKLCFQKGAALYMDRVFAANLSQLCRGPLKIQINLENTPSVYQPEGSTKRKSHPLANSIKAN